MNGGKGDRCCGGNTSQEERQVLCIYNSKQMYHHVVFSENSFDAPLKTGPNGSGMQSGCDWPTYLLMQPLRASDHDQSYMDQARSWMASACLLGNDSI